MQREESGWAVGWIAFASLMMIMLGVFHAIAGLIGILDDGYYVVGPKYILQFDPTTWGWIHLIAGIVVVLAGASLLKGAVWARTIGVLVALVSAVANFSWLPYQPIWSSVMIAVCIAVIWALTVHGRDAVA